MNEQNDRKQYPKHLTYIKHAGSHREKDLREKKTCEIGEESPTRSLESIIRKIQNPEAENEDCDGPRSIQGRITEEEAEVCGITDEKDSHDDEECAHDDEGAPPAILALAVITRMTNEGLHNEARDGST